MTTAKNIQEEIVKIALEKSGYDLAKYLKFRIKEGKQSIKELKAEVTDGRYNNDTEIAIEEGAMGGFEDVLLAINAIKQATE